MRVLAIDPGAKRCGWAVCEGSEIPGQILYVDSGIFGLVRSGNYQEYRLRLIEDWVRIGHNLLDGYDPTVVVNEIVPPAGGNIPSIINRQLALTVITTVQAVATDMGYKLAQLGASTVKRGIGGVGTASKAKVRNGVLSMLPDLEFRRKEWTGKDAVYDEVDAIAIGCSYLLKGLHGKPK